jgi:hypothetical protein
MGKYYYIYLTNQCWYRDEQGSYKTTETGKELEKIAGNRSLGYSEPSALALLGIKTKPVSKKAYGLFGIEYTETNYVDDPVFVICEDNNGYLEDVVTGIKFEKGKDYYHIEEHSPKLKASIVRELPAVTVANRLKNLSSYELKAYANKMYELKKAVEIGYRKDVQRKKNEQAQKEDYDAYIKSFRKKYGK